MNALSLCLAIALVLPASRGLAAAQREHVVDLGAPEDEQFIAEGVYQREGPNPNSQHDFYRENSMRWFGNQWRLRLPVWARVANLVTMRARFGRAVDLTLGDGWQVRLTGREDETYEYQFVLPASAVGDKELLDLRGRCDPPYQRPAGSRDTRELALAIDAFRVRALESGPAGVPVARREGAPPPPPEEFFLNLGLEGDDPYVGEGIYQREGPHTQAKDPVGRYTSFRWFMNQWTLKLPVFPNRHNEITLRGRSRRALRVSVGSNFSTLLFGASAPNYESRFVIPADRIGAQESLELKGSALPPLKPGPNATDERELVMLTDWVRIRPLDQVPEELMAIQDLPAEQEPDLPLPFRLRGTEMRPLFTDLEAYVVEARLMRCNVMTIGPMNGQHWTAFPTNHGSPHAQMQPDFLPSQVKALREHGIASIGWLPFNVQDLRNPDDCQAAKRHPEWRMEYLPWAERPAMGKVGMCIVSSPWRDKHAEILKEAAAAGLDGVFFDGFYLGGIPHPLAPGCVCAWCRKTFEDETGLAVPAQVDWTDRTFKRWVRWRNNKLLEVAHYFRDKMREANPGLWVTCNYNMWPFGAKDWDTAIPLWAMDDFGTSQHAYTGRPDLEWVMLGYKSRLSHDLHPKHSDLWRTSQPAWQYDDSDADRARHELTMRTFMLSGLTYGTTPWHGGHITPPEIGVRVHEAVRKRERFFSQEEFRHVGVVLSQNTHDFYGHLPGTTNLEDYRDTILGLWLLLTENHVPFRFVFDNQLNAEELSTYQVLLLPNTACLSDDMVAQLKVFVANGGRLIATAQTGAYDEWGDKRLASALDEIAGVVRLPGEPALAWLRDRDAVASAALLKALADVPAPFAVQGPRSLAVNATWSPDRKALWLHLLNVSAFYPTGDTGFRGIGKEAVYAGDVASDAQLIRGGKVKRENVPVRNLVVRTPGLKVASASLGVAGPDLQPQADGAWVIPELAVHEVLVLALQ